MPGLSVRNLKKSFGHLSVVDSLSFSVRPGELLTLLGPSGCGKTTTLRLIAGLEMPDSGEIAVGDRVLTSTERRIFVPPEKRAMGMVFQSYAVWPHMTVFENVAFPLKMKRVGRGEIRERVLAIIKMVGLAGLHDRPATMLSGGQQQRVALARSLVFGPAVLLLDEPFSNLDAQLREEMRYEVKELQRQLGLTMVFVTHDQKEATVLSDRLIVMNAGRIEQDGSVEEVYRGPASRFVFGFLGRANYLEARIERSNGTPVAVVEDGGLRFPLDGAATEVPEGSRLTIAFRPEDVSLEPAGEADDPWVGTIRSAVFGSQAEYVLDLGHTRLHAVGSPYDMLAVGSLARIHVRPGALRFWQDGRSSQIAEVVPE